MTTAKNISPRRYLAVDGAEGYLHDEGVDNAAADRDKVKRVPGVFEKILFVSVNGRGYESTGSWAG